MKKQIVLKAMMGIWDGCIYLLFGPFSVLYLFPEFLRNIEVQYIQLPEWEVLNITGIVLMWSGAVLALISASLMFMNKYSSFVPFFKPKTLLIVGPFAWVRHPMMWALFLVLSGETISYESPMTLLWLLCWIRFSYIYVERYEEPFLHRHFGHEYQEYCTKVPRWIPVLKKNNKTIR